MFAYYCILLLLHNEYDVIYVDNYIKSGIQVCFGKHDTYFGHVCTFNALSMAKQHSVMVQ